VYKHPLEVERSSVIRSIEWLEERRSLAAGGVYGDTYPVTWGADDNLYVGTGDPMYAIVDGRPRPCTWREAHRDPKLYGAMGGLAFEMITGSGMDFDVFRVNDMDGFTGPGGAGPKPTGVISVDGTIYYAIQNMLGIKKTRNRPGSQHGSDATIIKTTDYGKTWTPDLEPLWKEFEAEHYDRDVLLTSNIKEWKTPDEARGEYKGFKPMFPGPLFGGPTFVQFGKDNMGALDDYVYAVSSDQWDNGSELRAGRVKKERIMQAEEWEFAKKKDGKFVWEKGFEDSNPVLAIDGHISTPEVIYSRRLGKYILLNWSLHRDFYPAEGSSLSVFEANSLFGEWKLVHYEWMWELQEACPYCPRIPLKWFDQDTLTGYLLFSGSWQIKNPWYRPHVRKFKFVLADEVMKGPKV